MTWTGRSVGGIWSVGSSTALTRLLGWRAVALATPIIAAISLIAHGRARRSLDGYWRRQRPAWSAERRLVASWAHLTSFLRILADRVIAYAQPAALDLRVDGVDGQRLRQALAQPQGCILLSAHVGNWELAGRLLGHLATRRLSLVMIENEEQQVRKTLDAVMGVAPQIIDPRQGFAAALAIGQALAEGGIVCMLGDRVMPGQPACPARLLGAPLRLPAGPFQIAVSTGAPVLPCFLARCGRRSYRLLVGSPWRADPAAARRAQTAAGVRWWARNLDAFLRHYPRQWHNFFDLWAQ